jgi:hypothetical protein
MFIWLCLQTSFHYVQMHIRINDILGLYISKLDLIPVVACHVKVFVLCLVLTYIRGTSHN